MSLARVIPDILQGIRHAEALREAEGQTDAQLLERFVLGRDGVALEALVQRHAPMVWGVCRRTLAGHHAAEDAFQATFLVLLRKAPSIRSRELLANWLYRVAHKTACKARQRNAQRPVTPLDAVPEPQAEPHDDAFGPEWREWLDEELNRLPEKYRIAIVLCDLQGKSRPEVAGQLGVPEGTVGSRLARGRALLARRLARHGLTVSAGGLAAVCAQQVASGSVPAALLTDAIKATSLLAAGQPAAAGTISAPVALLTEEVLRAMTTAKQKKAAVLLVMATLVLAGGPIAYFALPGQPEPAPPPQPPKQTPEEAAVKMFGSEAGAIGRAKARLLSDWAAHRPREGLNPEWFWANHNTLWPARTFQAILDPETHRWTAVGDVLEIRHFERRVGERELVFGLEMIEWQVKFVISYDPSGHSYFVLSKDSGPEHPARTDDMGKWLQHDFQEPMRTASPVTSLRIVSGASGQVLSSYTGDELQVETGPRGVTVHANHVGAQPPAQPLTLQFGAPSGRFLDVGKYGGVSGGVNSPNDSAGPYMTGGNGEFVVWECEVRDQTINRLAIDYIAWKYSGADPPVYESLVSGSLRFKSLFRPAVAVPKPPVGVYKP
jgi:RNA polymerase sigma factor (sigma-70 family)